MSERIKMVAGNWKMHKTLPEARELARDIVQGVGPQTRAEVVLGPPYTALASVASELEGAPVRLAAQDTFWEAKGAYTGAIAPHMLVDVGCTYVIVGHSERRQYFGDTDEYVNR
ncbi:MAG: triose-phosphate isomerase, partial [Syntrophobacterales bacterium]